MDDPPRECRCCRKPVPYAAEICDYVDVENERDALRADNRILIETEAALRARLDSLRAERDAAHTDNRDLKKERDALRVERTEWLEMGRVEGRAEAAQAIEVLRAECDAAVADQCHFVECLVESESKLATARSERDAAREALASAVMIANEAAQEWDKAPAGMRAGKILLALAGHGKGYRSDTDAIHAALSCLSSPGAQQRFRDLPRCDFCDNQIEPEWAFCPFCSGVQNEDLITERAPGAQQRAGEGNAK
jgi:hypothetical protein